MRMSYPYPPDQRLGGLAEEVSNIWRRHSIKRTRGAFLRREESELRELWDRHWVMFGYLDDRPQDFTGLRLLAQREAPPLAQGFDQIGS